MRKKQGGAILVVALMFLVAITLYTISSMRSSNISLFMAQNEESKVAAAQAAPPRAVSTSLDKFSSASFRVTTTFDRVEDGLGREQISEGVLVLVPKQ
jgi:flagellar basal body-associated protein FliL